jgi:hypothetical protein
MAYDGTALTVTITDTVTTATAKRSYPVDIPTLVGNRTALVGFTGATCGRTATQDILSWTPMRRLDFEVSQARSTLACFSGQVG